MELNKKIHAKVKHNGYITFDDYMDMCLYYDDLGYYNNKNISLNPKNSDFITGPEISPIYTDSIINFYNNCKKNKEIDYVLEFGAGSGELAYNFLKNVTSNNMPKKYFILEKSKYLKRQQKDKINNLPKEISKKVEWINDVSNIKNVFLIANEVLDAIPAKRFIKKENKFYEKIIKSKYGKLYFSKRKCKPLLEEKIKNIENRINFNFTNNYCFEINFLYEEFFSNIFKNVENFIFILIDYGYGEKEFYHPDRSTGTIQYYKNNKKILDNLNNQGTFDISVSVDFSHIYRIINFHNLQLLSYTTQEQFLLETNILENSSKLSDNFERSNVLKSLLFPSDMGENFKIMILCDHMEKSFKMNFKDYRHRL